MNIYLVFIAGTEAMLLSAVAIILFAVAYQRKQMKQQKEKQSIELEHQRALNENYIRTTEDERRRIASDLHDEIGHSLLSIRLQLARFSGSENSRQLVDETIGKLRRIAYDLYPPDLALFGLQAALDELLRQAQQSSGLGIEASYTITDRENLTGHELTVYRIIQELLNNTIRHAEASLVSFQLTAAAGQLTVSYSDNGRGFEARVKKGKGLGLLSIENRIKAARGQLQVVSSAQKGFHAQICIPYTAQQEKNGHTENRPH